MSRSIALFLGALVFLNPELDTRLGEDPPAACVELAREDGLLRVLTYNVAGLPPPIARHANAIVQQRIGRLLRPYDIVLLQEDFYFHDALISRDEHPYRTRPQAVPFNDGLSLLSAVPFRNHRREPWTACHGFITHGADCMGPKGFSVAELEILPGTFIDVFNLHMDSGRSEGAIQARRSQARQLLRAIRSRAGTGNAMIVGGDFNDRTMQSALTFLIREAGLTDAGLGFVPGDHRLDRILYRSSDDLALAPVAYEVAKDCFARPDGPPLSDHDPVRIDFRYRRLD